LWGLYYLAFSADHLSCEVLPFRAANFHLNALKLLEGGPCVNCVSIGNLHHIGNGIVELDVTVRHPYYALVYSAFDVKGIIMFPGSLYTPMYQLSKPYPEIKPLFVAWAKLGDWELLNPDGYTYYWSPPFNADSEWLITKYFPGKFSKGTPNSTINAYKEFNTDEERHLFRAGHSVTRTYRIQTQPGPMVVGYAVDACWEPPLVTPVTDPLTDFPPTANQPEPYHFEVVINDGEPVPYGEYLEDPQSGRIKLFIDQWNGMTVTKHNSVIDFERPDEYPCDEHPEQPVWPSSDDPLTECSKPCGDNCFCGLGVYLASNSPPFPPVPEGWYRLVTVVYWGSWGDYYDHAVAVSDFYYDPQ
jgi:hypothetical protein